MTRPVSDERQPGARHAVVERQGARSGAPGRWSKLAGRRDECSAQHHHRLSPSSMPTRRAGLGPSSRGTGQNRARRCTYGLPVGSLVDERGSPSVMLQTGPETTTRRTERDIQTESGMPSGHRGG